MNVRVVRFGIVQNNDYLRIIRRLHVAFVLVFWIRNKEENYRRTESHKLSYKHQPSAALRAQIHARVFRVWL